MRSLRNYERALTMLNGIKKLVAILTLASMTLISLFSCSGAGGGESNGGKGKTVNNAYIINAIDFGAYRDHLLLPENEKDDKYTVPAVTELTAGNDYYIIAHTIGETRDGSKIVFKEDSSLSLSSSDGRVGVDDLIEVLDEGEIGLGRVTPKISEPESKDGVITYNVSASAKDPSAEFTVFVKFTAKTEGKLHVKYNVRGTVKKNEYSAIKAAEVEANVYFTDKVELNDVKVSFLASESYVDGNYDEAALADTLTMNVGKSYYMVISAKMRSLIEGSDTRQATLGVKVSPYSVLDGTVEVGPAGVTETTSGIYRNISAKFSMPEEMNEEREYKFIIKLIAATNGKANIDVSFSTVGISLVGTKKVEKTFYVASETVVSEGFEYALSENKEYYILSGPGSVRGGVFDIPAEYNGLPVKEIAPAAFVGEKTLREITVADSVTEIGAGAFERCTGLVSVKLPGGASLNKNVFEGCTALESVTLNLGGMQLKELFASTAKSVPQSLKNVTLVGDTVLCQNAFEGGTGIEKIHLPASLGEVSDSALIGLGSLSELEINGANQSYFTQCGILYKKNTVEVLGYVSVFPSEMTYPEGIKKLPGGDMSRVTHITVPSSAEEFMSEVKELDPREATGPAFVFNEMKKKDKLVKASVVGSSCAPELSGATKLTSVTLSDSVTELPEHFLYGCSEITSCTVPSGIKNIPKCAFAYCEKLSSITIPSGVTEIGESAFEHCEALVSVELPESVIKLGEYAFDSCTMLSSVKLSDNITEILKETFYKCEKLTTVNIPKEAVKVVSDAFKACTGLTTVTVSDGNTAFCSVDGILYNATKTRLYVVPSGKTGSVSLADTVVAVHKEAFVGCNGITEIIIPESVLCIEANAFSDCTSVSRIEFTDRTKIDRYSGGNLSGATTVTDPEKNAQYLREQFKDFHFGDPKHLK